ncbi:MAG: hypothetical protein ACLRSW_14600 [Christensenellaceae bacterium]
MIILIGGESHTGKTFLAQRLLNGIPSLFQPRPSQMGLIRGLADCGFPRNPRRAHFRKMWRIVEGSSSPAWKTGKISS